MIYDDDSEADAIDAACRRFLWDGDAMIQHVAPDVPLSEMQPVTMFSVIRHRGRRVTGSLGYDDSGWRKFPSGRRHPSFKHGRTAGRPSILGRWREEFKSARRASPAAS